MIKNVVENKFFERFIIAIILINGVTMGLETSKDIMQNYGGFLHLFDNIVVGIFTLEAILKIITYRSNYFKNGWNLFDFTIVVISLVPSSGPFQILRILRVFRLLRLVTVIPSMRKIVSALFSVIPGMASVGALLLIVFYVFAIMTTQLYGETFPEWFGSIGSSFYTLFQIMTLESWSMGIVRPIMEVHPNAWFLFVCFVLVVTFVMVNLIIAIVVEAMNKISHDEKNHISKKIQESENATKGDLKRLEDKIEKLGGLVEKKR